MDYIYQAEDMLKNIGKTENKMLIKAAQCRYVNTNFSILLKIKKDKKYKKERIIALDNITKYKCSVLFNLNSRIKTKVAIILSYFNCF